MDLVRSRRVRVPVVLLVVGASLVGASCRRLLSTRVATIEGNVAQYDGKTITVYGKVKERIDLPGLKCYVVDDGTGSIGVVTKKALPRIGDTVRTSGKVNASFKIGKRPLIAVIEPAPVATPRPKVQLKGPLPS